MSVFSSGFCQMDRWSLSITEVTDVEVAEKIQNKMRGKQNSKMQE